MPSSKPEFPPLLAVGFHEMTLGELRESCVAHFALSTTRNRIMAGLEAVVEAVCRTRIAAEVWIDGSFLTEKTDPEDVDVVFRVQAAVYDRGTDDVRNVLDWINSNLKASHECDTYIFYEWPMNDPHHSIGVRMYDYWSSQFGSSRRGEGKGIAVVRIPQE